VPKKGAQRMTRNKSNFGSKKALMKDNTIPLRASTHDLRNQKEEAFWFVTNKQQA
jgi:hypothetical protein